MKFALFSDVFWRFLQKWPQTETILAPIQLPIYTTTSMGVGWVSPIETRVMGRGRKSTHPTTTSSIFPPTWVWVSPRVDSPIPIPTSRPRVICGLRNGELEKLQFFEFSWKRPKRHGFGLLLMSRCGENLKRRKNSQPSLSFGGF